MSDNILPNRTPEADLIGINPFVNPSQSSNPSVEPPLLDLGLGSQVLSYPPPAPAATIDTTSELLIPGVHKTSVEGLSAGRVQSAETMNNFGSAAVDIDLLEKQITAKEQARREKDFVDLTGEIAGASSNTRRTRSSAVEPNLDADFDTLDEPVWDTVRRDLRCVGAKFGQVLVPRKDQQLLRDWDLWGPLFICVFLSLLLQSADGSNGPRFTEVFSMTFFGSLVVTLNMKLLGGHISFFQTLCVLGYCLLPPATSALLCELITLISFRFLITGVGFAWATYASMAFLWASLPENRKALCIYPIFLFYFFVSWMILTHSVI